MMHCRDIHNRPPDVRLRAVRAEHLALTLGDAHPADATAICVAYLNSMSPGAPQPRDPFGDLRADADFWADLAHEAELEAYFAATLRRLGKRHLGREPRKRLFKELWRSFTDAERAAFLKKVTGGGNG